MARIGADLAGQAAQTATQTVQIRLNQLKSDHIRPDQPKSCQVRSDQTKSDQIRPDKLKLG